MDIITHHHRTWINRNAIAHPKDELPTRAKQQRPRKHTPRAPPQSTPALKRKARSWATQRSNQLKRKTMWRTGDPIPHTSPPWVRLCRLAQHSNSTIRRKRKRAQARAIQHLEDAAPPRRPRLTAWKRRNKQKRSDIDHQQQPVEPDSTQSLPAATRLDDTRGGSVNPPDIRIRTGGGTTGPEAGVMDARGGNGVHRWGGGRRQEGTAHQSRHHTENRGHRAVTLSNQRTSSERIEPFKGTMEILPNSKNSDLKSLISSERAS